MSWALRIPYRDPNEPLDARTIWELPNTLDDPEEKAVCREWLIGVRLAGGKTVGQARDLLETSDQADRSCPRRLSQGRRTQDRQSAGRRAALRGCEYGGADPCGRK
jgi:hypothetical protein